MDSMSSSLFSPISHLLSPTKHHLNHISAVRIQENNATSVSQPLRQQFRPPKPPRTPQKRRLPSPLLPATIFNVFDDKENIPTTTSPTRQYHIHPPPKRRPPPPSVLATIFNVLDDIINTFIDPPLKPSVDPRHVLCNNFAPVDELPPTECEVIYGSLLPCLDGAYIRNGPNPQYLPRGPYHLFDGDGMLHSVRISCGRATLCSRYVKTYKYMIERDAGSPVVPSIFSGFNRLAAFVARGAVSVGRMLTGQFNLNNGIGSANTSLALIGGKLYATCESDLPYIIKVTPEGEILTLNRDSFGGKLSTRMTAHPKIDPETGEAFAFQYSPKPPFLTYFFFDSNGEKQPDVPIFSMKTATFVHDFAITKNYAIFCDIQLGLNLMGMILSGGSLVEADSRKVTRIGIIPRYATNESEMRWFDVAGFNILHAINAWEEDGGDTVVMVAPNILSVEHTFERLELVHGSVERVKIDLKSGTVSRHPASARNLDLGVINPAFIAKKNRYVYAAVMDPMPKVIGVVKLDLSILESERRDCITASRIYGGGCFGGEPFFVAREPQNPNAKEDDGYVVSYVHNEQTRQSSFLVMDAQSPDLEIVAAVKLPSRVPYGFHGLFLTEKDLLQL